jgi:hypothetical protein
VLADASLLVTIVNRRQVSANFADAIGRLATTDAHFADAMRSAPRPIHQTGFPTSVSRISDVSCPPCSLSCLTSMRLIVVRSPPAPGSL